MWRCRPRFGLPHMSIATREFLRDYWSCLKKLPELVKHISFSRRSLEQELQEAVLRGSLRKAFSGMDLLLLGLGIIIGTGIYTVTGTQLDVSGSGIVIAYSLSCLLGIAVAACFGELSMEYPVSGGAFTYTMLTFGELPAWLTVSFLIQQYIFGLAVEGRGFSTYITQLFGQPENLFRYPKCVILPDSDQCQVDIYALDFMAPAIILVLTLVISAGGRESSFFISTVTLVKIVVMVVIFATAFTQANPSYLRPDGNFFTPEWGVDGVFKAMATLFFTFVGFDAITNAAEEVDDISYLPWALVGSVFLAGVLYVVMSLSLVMMVPYTALILPADGTWKPNEWCRRPSSYSLTTDLAFTKAFKCIGLNWVPYVVATASLLGILTAMLVGLFAVARLVMSASRDWLLPPSLARISTRTQTPLIAQITIGIVTALVAMIGSEGLMANLSVFGALFGSWWVVNAQIFRRYYPDVKLRFTRYGTVETQQAKTQYRVPGSRLSRETRMILVWVHLAAITAIGLATSIYYQMTGPTEPEDKAPSPPPPPSITLAESGSTSLRNGPAMLVFLGIWFLVTLSMQLLCPLEYEPPKWHIPWWMLPWVPSAAIAFIIFSISNLQPERTTFVGIAICMTVTLLIYFLFSLPMSYIKHFKVDYAQTEKLRVVELVCQGGQWKPAKGQAVSFALQPAHSAAHSHKTDILSLAGRPSARPSLGTQPSMQPRNGAAGLSSSQESGSSGQGSEPSAHGRRVPPRALSIPEEENPTP